jgi:hypothetical protein
MRFQLSFPRFLIAEQTPRAAPHTCRAGALFFARNARPQKRDETPPRGKGRGVAQNPKMPERRTAFYPTVL